jgi:hypothetical protein
MLSNLNLDDITTNEYLKNTLLNLFKYQVNSLVLITILLQPWSVVNNNNYVFKLTELDEFNIKKNLSNKSKSNTNTNTNSDKDNDTKHSISCIKLIKKFMKDNTPYHQNSIENLVKHYYSILENKESAHKLLWFIFNIYYLECIYDEFKNQNSSTYQTYVRLFAIKPSKSDSPYLDRIQWIANNYQQGNLQGLINFSLFISMKEENGHFFYEDSELEQNEDDDDSNNNNFLF